MNWEDCGEELHLSHGYNMHQPLGAELAAQVCDGTGWAVCTKGTV